MQQKNKRNGKIELLRFIFCIFILFYHIGLPIYGRSDTPIIGDHITFFSKGYLGVEFFFLVTGFLMARSAHKTNRTSNNSVGTDSLRFMKKKIWSIFPYHLVAFYIMFAGICIGKHLHITEIITSFFRSIPDLFFLSMSGISCGEVNPVAWYLSAMFITMAILYPLCRKHFDFMSKAVAPVLSVLLIGYLCQTNGKYQLALVRKWDSICYVAIIRAMAEILLGVFCYTISLKLKELKLTDNQRKGITVLEFALYAICLVYMTSTLSYKLNVHCLLGLAVAITITFSDISYKPEICNNRFCYALGKASMPIYLVQMIPREVWLKMIGTPSSHSDILKYVIFVVTATLVLALIVKLIGDFIMKMTSKKA